jgi:chaperonin GroES
MSIKPLADRVLVEPTAAETKTASGIYIPDSAKEKPLHGTIVAIGDSEDINVKVGDKVIYTRYAGTELNHEGKDYLIMSIKDVLAII